MSSQLFWKLFAPLAILNCIALVGLAWIGWGDSQFLQRLGIYPFIFLAVLLVATWYIVSSILKPVDALTEFARRMAVGDYDLPVYVGTTDELGQLARTFNVMRDDVQNRTAETKRLATVLAAMTDGVIAIDEEQRVQYANPAAGHLLDFSPSEAEGRPILESVRSHRIHEMVVRLVASHATDEVEIEWGQDHPRTLLVSATFFSDQPSAGIIMMINNLSEERRLETMRRDFVANVSHELKTPLSAIKAYAETLSNGAINDEKNRNRFVNNIEEQADRLHQLISDLLSLARIEQGNSLMEIGQVDPIRVIRTCVEEQLRAAAKKNITLTFEPADTQVLVESEEDGLRQIMVNLIDNAIKYTPEGGNVTVRTETEDDKIKISVQDTGIGIPEEMQNRVFERFFRVDKARSRELGGTGLGLAIVKHLAQSYGGTAGVVSEQGKGSCFSVTLMKVNTALLP